MWDQAGFHTAGEISVPHTITIVQLPPYSPPLNPVQRLWPYLRHHYWSNRVYENYDILRIAAVDAWQRVCLDNSKIQSLCQIRSFLNEKYLRRLVLEDMKMV